MPEETKPENAPYKKWPAQDEPSFNSKPQIPIFSKEKKAEEIKNWNEKPVIKENNIKAVDANGYSWLKTLAFIGIIALIIIAVGVGTWGYTIWKDGTLVPNFICPNQSITISDQGCSNTQKCGDCNPQINITLPNYLANCPVCNCPTCRSINEVISELNLTQLCNRTA